MSWVHLVIGLCLLQFFFFCMAVGRARGTYKIKAPATTGNEVFERYFRVQMNTLELLVILVPSMVIFAAYWNPCWAAALGAIYFIGRIMYFRGYVQAPEKRSWGYGLSAIPVLIVMVGAVLGAAMALVRHA